MPDLPPPDAPIVPQNLTVKVRGEILGFDPKVATVAVFGTVTWTWEAGNNHTIVSGGAGGPGNCASDGKFSSGLKTTGQTFSLTFTEPGTYSYHCAAHCIQFEGGTILVE
jgi:plastocyanin